MSETKNIKVDQSKLELLKANKEDGIAYRERRVDEWELNYTHYRGRVEYNRLIQRQSISIPIMKKTIKTLLKDVDDLPVVYFENLDNDKQAELFKNDYWEYMGSAECNNFALQDLVDKKQILLFGRSYDQWQIVDGKIKMTIVDPNDILVSRFVDPFNIHSSRYLIHQHIFVPLSSLKYNKDYDQKAVKELEKWAGSTEGIIKTSDNKNSLEEKNETMLDMGLDDVNDPVLGETYVELTQHFIFEDDEDGSQIYLYVEAEDQQILMSKSLEEVIGVTKNHWWRNHYPYNSWAEDLERQDWYTDSVADVMRPICQIADSYVSQLLENRTLVNYNMHYYDGTNKKFVPQTYTPRPWGWYALPGKPADIIQSVEVKPLGDSLGELTFFIQEGEKATGATATQQGTQTERKVTLGEVELALGEAKERVKGMSKLYTPVWQQRAITFDMLIEAAGDRLDAVKIYKKGKTNDDYFVKEVSPDDFLTPNGYKTKIWSQDEKTKQDSEQLQIMQATMSSMPDNPKLKEIYQRKLLEFNKLTPEQINDVMEFEQRKAEMMINRNALGLTAGQQGMPVEPGQVDQAPIEQLQQIRTKLQQA